MATNPTAAVSYKGVFNRSIYVQSDLKLKAENRENQLKDHLRKKKVERLQEVIKKNYGDRISQYREIVEDHNVWRYYARPFLEGLPMIGNIVSNFGKEWSTISKDEAKKKLFELAGEERTLLEGVDKESILEIEYRYILKKSEISSEDLKEQIENSLLMMREQGLMFQELVTKFIDNALSVPFQALKLTCSPNDVLFAHGDQFFKNFDPSLLHQLEVITYKLIQDSQHEVDNSTSKRGIYYFSGNSGAGKSSAAKKLVKELGLPYFVYDIKTPGDLSSANLEGSERTMSVHCPGLLAKALMSKNSKDGKPYKNAVLIIEDFDRLLLDREGQAIPEALSFLLEYLDPEKREYLNPYFNGTLDISMLTIIITANYPIPKRDKSKKIDPLAALRSRIIEVEFPDFPEPKLTEILKDAAKNILVKYRNKIDTDKLIAEVIATQKTQDKPLEPRELIKRLELEIAKCDLAITREKKQVDEKDRAEKQNERVVSNSLLFDKLSDKLASRKITDKSELFKILQKFQNESDKGKGTFPTPEEVLMRASLVGDVNTVKAIIMVVQDIDFAKKSTEGKTALDYAKEKKHVAIEEILREKMRSIESIKSSTRRLNELLYV